MYYRCPNCGKEVFSTRIKLGLTSKFGQSPICPSCKKAAFRNLSVGGYYADGLSDFIIVLVFLFILFLSIKTGLEWLILIGFFVMIALLLLKNYYFSYFDVFPNDKSKFTYFTIKMSGDCSNLPIRRGEICLIVPHDATNPEKSSLQAFAMLEQRSKSATKHELLFRMIKIYEGYSIKSGDKIKIIRHNGDDFQGILL